MYERVLIVDDEEGMVSFIRDALKAEGYEVTAPVQSSNKKLLSCGYI